MIVTGGLHGNEPSGAFALRRVAPKLEALRHALRGRVVGLSGNRGALERGCRFVERDLNRGWKEEFLTQLLSASREHLRSEDLEQRELAERQLALEHQRSGPMVFLDLHTTSGPSEPFVCFGDTLVNRRLALALPITAILGLEEVIDGAMLGYWTDRGHAAIAVEAGRHDDAESIERHEAAIWLCLASVGAFGSDQIPDLERHAARLQRASAGVPRLLEVRHRHEVGPDDAFEMLAGFRSFQPVARGQPVARDRNGPITATESGLMLMPRYQGQGEDGFFLVRKVARFWLGISAGLRRGRVARLLPLVPGIARHASEPDCFMVKSQALSFFTIGLLHLCGYRRKRGFGARAAFLRRRSGV